MGFRLGLWGWATLTHIILMGGWGNHNPQERYVGVAWGEEDNKASGVTENWGAPLARNPNPPLR